MQFVTIITALTLAALSAANPIQKRDIGGVLICNGAEATGACNHTVYALDTCYNMTAEFFQDAATFAPDSDVFYCYPYIMACGGRCTSPTGCTAGALSYNSTNKFNLTNWGGWDHLISSFECHAGPAPTSLYGDDDREA